jgi:hypothetical protein
MPYIVPSYWHWKPTTAEVSELVSCTTSTQNSSKIISIIAADLMNYLLQCSNENMLVILLYLKPLLDALACVDEKSPVRITTTTPGRFMVKGHEIVTIVKDLLM